MASHASRGEWLRQPADPDPERDLGYVVDEWEAVEARRGGEQQLMFLPGDEDLLRQEAFLVVSPEDVRDLDDTL